MPEKFTTGTLATQNFAFGWQFTTADPNACGLDHIVFSQIDDAVHDEPEPLHPGQRVKQAVVSAAIALGRPGPMGWPDEGRKDQGILPEDVSGKLSGRSLSPRRSPGARQQGLARMVAYYHARGTDLIYIRRILFCFCKFK